MKFKQGTNRIFFEFCQYHEERENTDIANYKKQYSPNRCIQHEKIFFDKENTN